MKRLRLKNFRSLVDTGDVELRPLTVLVGTNSSGKSSFLRFFPLLRQTMESSSRAPLLWCGRLVDFGDFKSAARRHEPSLPIGVEFESELSRWSRDGIPVQVSLEIQGNEQTTWLSACEMKEEPHRCRFEFDEAGIVTQVRANGHDFSEELRSYILRRSLRPHLIPDLEWAHRSPVEAGAPIEPAQKLVADELAKYASRRTKQETLFKYAYNLLCMHADAVPQALKELRLRHLSAMNQESVERIQGLAFLRTAPRVIDIPRNSLDAFITGITYLGPFRQDPERYYRHQELSVAQIEPHGENLAMFIRALNNDQVLDLSNFVKKYLGYGVGVRSVGAHVEVFIKEESGAEFNLIDMGYGFSQVLPIIAQCWATSSGLSFQGRTPLTTMLAMEQPELHLHPAHQAKLADMLAGVLQATADRPRVIDPYISFLEDPQPTRLIVETHSETLVNRLGELIEKGSLNTTDISVLLFEKDPATGSTSVRICEFNPDGTLTNWPIGFFSP